MTRDAKKIKKRARNKARIKRLKAAARIRKAHKAKAPTQSPAAA